MQIAPSYPASGKAKVRVIHAAPEVPAVDVAVEGGPTLFEGVEFPSATDYAEVAATTYPVTGPVLRLVTCGGAFDGSSGHYLDNLVVTARWSLIHVGERAPPTAPQERLCHALVIALLSPRSAAPPPA